MAALDTRGDRVLWGIGNLAAGFLCIPLCYGLSSKDFASFKIALPIVGAGMALNSVRLFYQHEQGAGVRSAWRASAEMVSGAWIEQVALSNLPPIYQAPVYQPKFTEVENLQPLPLPAQFQIAAPPQETQKPPNPGDGRSEFIQSGDRLLGVELPAIPNFGIKFFDWRQFKENPDSFSHIRGVGATNSGKTTLIDWLMDVFPADRKTVHTIKRKPHQWKFLEVVGVPEDFEAIRRSMLAIREERIRRTRLMEAGKDFPRWSAAFDEWKITSKNIKAVVDRKTKEIISPSAKELQGENLALARELKIRIFALAQGRQVITWGLEGESDMLECFTSIFLGKFAVEECESYRNKFPKDSEQYAKYQQVRDYLESLGNRAAWISSELGEFPAVVPDLSRWRRETSEFPLVPDPSLGTPQSVPRSEPEKPETPDGTRAERFSTLLAEILAETSPAVFSPDFPLEHQDKVELAKLIIAQNLGQEKTILLLWGVRRGGRNHHLYVEAKSMLDRLISEIR
ncbi:hypothetical protein QUA41_30650 [Microcoleus sp. Pol11C1]|uniref:hypothetical protein n=1 Tax=unclassified Microcoleus TaxID=2642155 RepID=UPI002FD1090D